MATELKPLVFDDGADLVVRVSGQSVNINAETLDIQEGGVMFEYTDNGVTSRVFRPWNMVVSITQVVT